MSKVGDYIVKHKVLKKQHNSKTCLVCGLKNDVSLRAAFYELDNKELVALFRTQDRHQSYPGRTHGGIIGAILDETIGRAVMIDNENIWGVTVELNVKYRKPIPLNEDLKAVGRIIKDSSRLFEGTGEILLPSGEVAASAWGKYMKMPIEKIADFFVDHEEWQVVASEDDPIEIEI